MAYRLPLFSPELAKSLQYSTSQAYCPSTRIIRYNSQRTCLMWNHLPRSGPRSWKTLPCIEPRAQRAPVGETDGWASLCAEFSDEEVLPLRLMCTENVSVTGVQRHRAEGWRDRKLLQEIPFLAIAVGLNIPSLPQDCHVLSYNLLIFEIVVAFKVRCCVALLVAVCVLLLLVT